MSEEIYQEQEILEEPGDGQGVLGNKVKRLSNVIKFIVAIILVVVVFSQTDIQQLIALEESLSFSWVFGYFAVFFLLLLIKVFQYWVLFGGRVSFQSMLRIVVWQNSLSNLVATGAGIASYLAMLRAEQGMRLSSSSAVFIVTKIGEVFIIGVYLGISAGLLWGQIEGLHVIVFLFLTGILVGFAGFIIAILFRDRFFHLIQRAFARLRLDRLSTVDRVLISLRSLTNLEQKYIFKMLAVGVGISVIYVSLANFLILVGLKIFSFDVGIWPIVFVASFLQLFANIPIQVLGGLGVSEITSVFIYGLFGIDTAEMSAVQLGIRAVFYLSNAAMLLYLPVEGLLSRNRD